MNRTIPAVVAFGATLAAALSAPASRAQTPPASYQPPATTVAVLPAQNVSGDKDADRSRQDADGATKAATDAFASRGFTVADPKTVLSAVQSAKVDLTSQASWTPETFAKIGRACNADLVILVAVTKTHRGGSARGGFGRVRRDGEADVTTWVVDAKQQTVLISGTSTHAKERASGGHGFLFGGFDDPEPYVLRAIRGAISTGLADFLKPYPEISKK